GLSTPAAKLLPRGIDPWMLAGLLYLGSGVGLGVFWLARAVMGRDRTETPLRRRDLPWLSAAVVTGGGIGPLLLMSGLALGSASQSSLLLNLEGVFTALFAWLVVREHFDARIAAGIGLITLGACLLAWNPAGGFALDAGAPLVAGACLAWAADNNLTRKIAA